MLNKVEMPFNFTQGVDTQTDEKLNVKLDDLINGVHEGQGTISLRDGFTQMPTDDTDGNTIEPGLRVSSNGETLQLFTAKGAYDFSKTLQLWDKKSDFSYSQISAQKVLDDPNSTASDPITSAKTAAIDGFYVIEAGGYLRVYDSTSDTEISIIQDQGNPFVVGTDIWSYYDSGSFLDFRKLNKTTGVMDAQFTLNPADYPSPRYITGTSDGNFLIISIDSGAIDVTILSTAPAIIDSYTYTPSSGAITAAKGYFNGTNYIIGFYNNTTGSTYEIGILVLDSNLDFVSANQYSFTTSASGSIFTLTQDGENYYFLAQGTTASSSSGLHTIRKSDLSRISLETMGRIESEFTRTFEVDYALVTSRIGNSFYLLSNLGEYVAILNSNSLTADFNGELSQISKVGDEFFFAARTDDEDVKLLKANFDSPISGPEVDLEGITITPGGRLVAHDGSDFFAFGIESPEITSGSEGAAGNVANGTYDYCVILEYRDNRGRVWRSAPSNVFEVTVSTGPKNVAISYDMPIGFLGDSGQLFAELYRRNSGDIVFKKVREEVADGSMIDSTADNSSNEALYTTGGILENDPPPPADSIAIIGNRMWAVSVDDGLLYYSKPITAGLGIEFSLFQYIQFNDGGGRPKTVSGMDEKVIVFKDSSIYVIQGSGPNATGEGGVFSEPYKLPADVGCPYPASVVVSPAGIMFKSKKGIRLLDRSLSVQDIGREVARFNDETITSAILMEEKNQIRFTTKEGRALVYDYQYGQWETFDNYASKSATQNFSKVVHVDSSGDVQLENEIYQDNGDGINLTVKTPWIKAKNIQDYQRFYRLLLLGDYMSAHQLRVRAFYNYDDTSYDEYTLEHTSGVLQWQVHLKRQKCEAIKFELYSIPVAPYGAQLRLTNMTLQVGVKKGTFKLPDSRSY